MFAELNDQGRLGVESETPSGSKALLGPAPEWLEALEGCCPDLSVPRPSWQAAGLCVLAGARRSYAGLPFGDTQLGRPQETALSKYAVCWVEAGL